MTLLLVVLYSSSLFLIALTETQFTQTPRSTTVALGRNATFYCRGNGDLVWEISGTQIRDPIQVVLFAQRKIYAPIHQPNSTQVIITATQDNNYTSVVCLLGPHLGTVDERSMDVRLLLYAEPFPPSNLAIDVDGLNLVVTWTEPFSLQGEEIYYVVSITNMASGANILEETIRNRTSFVLDDSIALGTRDCTEYEFTVYSRNSYALSDYAISGRRPIPTVPLVMRKSDVQVNVTLQVGVPDRVEAVVTFNPRDPCPSYPVTSYTFYVMDTLSTNTTTSTRSVVHTNNNSLLLDGDNIGLVPNRVYRLSIRAENAVGRTSSEDNILLYTTGLQSVRAVMELDGSITVTCTFATGASSTGCLVTIFTTDNSQLMEILSKNILREEQNGNTMYRFSSQEFTKDSTILLEFSELRGQGVISDVLFNISLVVTKLRVTTLPINRAGSGAASTQIIGVAVSIASVFIIVSLALIIIFVVCYRRRRTSGTSSNQSVELKPNDIYGINLESFSQYDNSHYDRPRPPQAAPHGADGIDAKPNQVYGVSTAEVDWSVCDAAGEQSESHYSYVGLERTMALYETIDGNYSKRPGNKYVTS